MASQIGRSRFLALLGAAGSIASILSLILPLVSRLAFSDVLWFAIAISTLSNGLLLYLWFRSRSQIEGAEDCVDLLRAAQSDLEAVQEELKASQAWTDALEQAVDHGIKWIENHATVRIYVEDELYRLSFEKRFEVISAVAPDILRNQFYCNIHLEDANEAVRYYMEHPPLWADLQVGASIQVQEPGQMQPAAPVDLLVQPLTDESHYIPFNIVLKELVNGREGAALELRRGSVCTLRYSYVVSADLWGSYLNRHVSVWGEPTDVRIELPVGRSYPPDIFALYRLRSGRDPLRVSKFSIDTYGSDWQSRTIEIPAGSRSKFRVEWDTEELMGISMTRTVADASYLTDF